MEGSLLLAYFFTTFVVGATCVGAALLLVRLRSDELARAFLWFYVPLSVAVLGALLLAFEAMQPQASPTVGWLLVYLEAFVGRYGVMLTLPLFVHRVVGVRSRRADAVIVGGVLVTFALQHLSEFALGGTVWDDRGDLLEDVVFGGVIAYTLWVAVRHRGRGACPALSRRLLGLFLLAMPVTAYDIFIADGPGPRFFPLLYCAVGITVIVTLAGRPVAAPGSVPVQWHLTRREGEILRLVQRG